MSQQQQFSASTSNERREPPVWFDLSEITPKQAFEDMECFTNKFNSITDKIFVDDLCKRLSDHYYGPYGSTPVIIGYIPAPPKSNLNSQDVIKKVIGSQGYWLKRTTQNSNAHFIWYDPALNNFLFWAPNRHSIVRAMKAIRWRIMKYWEFSYHQPTRRVDEDDDDCADMPELIDSSEKERREFGRSYSCNGVEDVEYYGEEEAYNEEDDYNQSEADAYFMGQRCNWALEGKRMVL